MLLMQIESIHGYKPRPDYKFRIHESGQVRYKGRYYVGVVGETSWDIPREKVDQIKLLLDYLKKRNQKSYLRRIQVPIFKVVLGEGLRMQFEVDVQDVVSEDIIRQIIELSGVGSRVYAELDLYFVMSKPANRSKEIGVVRAVGAEEAVAMYLKDRGARQFITAEDFWAFRFGRQNPGTLHNPLIYFTFTDYQIQKDSVQLFLNQGEPLTDEPCNVFIFISFGKRYNDPKASYFLVLARDGADARRVLHQQYPHFLERDFQLVDTESSYQPIPMFTTRIPVGVR